MPDLRALTLKHLRAHEATVRHGSVTAAARELLVTPPAITAQLKALEDLIGAPLYDRSHDGFVPTEIGGLIVRATDDIERLMSKLQAEILALQTGAKGSVVFGAVSTAKYIIPSIVAQFHAAHPDITVRLVIGNREDILRGLDYNEFDLLVMGRPPEHVPLHATVLADHPHIVIAAPTHPLAALGIVEAEQLRRERFLSRESGSGTRMLMERFLARISPDSPVEVVDMGTNETIKQAVMAGLGIALISRHTCIAELEADKLVALPVAGLPIVRQWYLIRRADREPTAATRILAEFITHNSVRLMPRAVPAG